MTDGLRQVLPLAALPSTPPAPPASSSEPAARPQDPLLRLILASVAEARSAWRSKRDHWARRYAADVLELHARVSALETTVRAQQTLLRHLSEVRDDLIARLEAPRS